MIILSLGIMTFWICMALLMIADKLDNIAKILRDIEYECIELELKSGKKDGI